MRRTLLLAATIIVATATTASAGVCVDLRNNVAYGIDMCQSGANCEGFACGVSSDAVKAGWISFYWSNRNQSAPQCRVIRTVDQYNRVIAERRECR